MHINDDHMYHGSALCQIAEHESFTAINAFETSSGVSRSAFRVNSDIGVFLKYATKPSGTYKEYVFTFAESHLREIELISNHSSNTFIALVCVKDREICCLPKEELFKLIRRRMTANDGDPEDSYTVLATLEKGKAFRVYMNAPGRKKTILGKQLTVTRKKFPAQLFE